MHDTQAIGLAKSIQLDRITSHLDELAQIGGAEQGGITRLAFSEEDRQARRLVAVWMREAGLNVRVDPIGNIIGRLEGSHEDALTVMTGSHIDTVVMAGRLDGALGVVGAIEVAQVLTSSGTALPSPLEIVCFVMEESARFGNGYAFGSKAMTGQQLADDTLLARDRGGATLAQVVFQARAAELGQAREPRDQRYMVETVRTYVRKARYPMERVKAFVELHIEQGPVLDGVNKSVGAVTAIAAPTRLVLTLCGEQNHSGTTPMAHRRDALVAAAEVIQMVEHLCTASDSVLGTVGTIEVEPNVINTIPGRTQMVIDLRSTSSQAKARVVEAIHAEVDRIASRRDIIHQLRVVANEAPQQLSPKIVSLIEENCLRLQIDSHRLASGAGHDAAQLAKLVEDTGMIFVPSCDGISHSPRERTDERDLLRGTQVLFLTLFELAQ